MKKMVALLMCILITLIISVLLWLILDIIVGARPVSSRACSKWFADTRKCYKTRLEISSIIMYIAKYKIVCITYQTHCSIQNNTILYFITRNS